MQKAIELLPLAFKKMAALGQIDGVCEIIITGSVRRGVEMVSDVDLLIVTTKPELIEYAGDFDPKTKPTEFADVFIVRPETRGSALAYTTGPRKLNRRLKLIARSVGLSYETPGILFDGSQALEIVTEACFFKSLGVPYVPASHRDWLADRI